MNRLRRWLAELRPTYGVRHGVGLFESLPLFTLVGVLLTDDLKRNVSFENCTRQLAEEFVLDALGSALVIHELVVVEIHGPWSPAEVSILVAEIDDQAVLAYRSTEYDDCVVEAFGLGRVGAVGRLLRERPDELNAELLLDGQVVRVVNVGLPDLASNEVARLVECLIGQRVTEAVVSG